MSEDVAALVDTVVRRTIALSEVPAPTGGEGDRAELVRSWWEADGHGDVRLDTVGNVWARARAGDGPALLLCAHLDTVFAADVPHAVRTHDGALHGPSVGDDSVGVAALSATASLLGDGSMPVWLLSTVGEEGLGNLRGAISALEDPPAEVGAFVAIEGNYLGRVSTTGVGSCRRRVTVRGPGGHAWEAADSPSAIHRAAELVVRIESIPRARGTSVNIGRIGGGEGINMRAREAWFEVDLRADDPGALDTLTGSLEALLAAVEEPLRVEQEVLGDRPAGRLDPGHPLVGAAVEALASVQIEATSPSTSTDANAAHARGIPAVALGVTTGSGEHTPHEWIAVGPIERGLRALAGTVQEYEVRCA
jgi:acetylornithine deacetylase/succinyl-diaminopimelate desuccinylase-like protein